MGAKVQVSKSWEILGFFLQAGKEKRGKYMLRTKKIHFSENQSGIRKGRLWGNVYIRVKQRAPNISAFLC